MTSRPHKIAADLISSLPLIRYLRQNQQRQDAYKESRPYSIMNSDAIPTHLVSGSLFTPNKLPVAPYFFTKSQPIPSLIAACYVGTHLTGHAGFVHGGLHFLLFDDAFAYCASQVFKSRIGMTANLHVDFRQPSLPNRVYVYRCTVEKIDGRKAYIVGEIRSLNASCAEEMLGRPVADGDGPSVEEREGILVAEARALFIEPRDTLSMLPLYPESSECI
ncbi:HotDog domain-containing protein [Aspergillus tamarii]|uniref:HotDog domain-containing protein n=1 Tax=Aspergillus tamarii TaxID=41984 RepID=A0A5N6UNX0_ASPTM|nr:HotDog domain-containing protein [Aspergillus tamarii]